MDLVAAYDAAGYEAATQVLRARGIHVP